MNPAHWKTRIEGRSPSWGRNHPLLTHYLVSTSTSHSERNGANMSTSICPPFTLDSALAKVQAAEDAWNSRDPERVSLAYTEDSEWRNRSEFLRGREAIRVFLTRKWERERECRLKKEGPSGKTGSLSDSSMNGTTRLASGIAPTAMRCGSSTSVGSWRDGTLASMTCRSSRRSDVCRAQNEQPCNPRHLDDISTRGLVALSGEDPGG